MFNADVAVRDEKGNLIAHASVPIDANGMIDAGQLVRDAQHAAAVTKQDQDDKSKRSAATGNDALNKLLNADR